MSSAAVVIGALRVNKALSQELFQSSSMHEIKCINSFFFLFFEKEMGNFCYAKAPHKVSTKDAVICM